MPRVIRIDPKVDPKTYMQIEARYKKFLENVNDPNKPVIKVYEPLPKGHIDAMEICREVSRELLKKKDDDIMKQKQQAEEAEKEKEEAKRLAAEKKDAEVKEKEVEAEAKDPVVTEEIKD